MTATQEPFLTIGNLKAAIADLPDDMPVLLETPEWPYVVRAEECGRRLLQEVNQSREIDAMGFQIEDCDKTVLVIS